MTIYGGESGHESVGINVSTDSYDTNTAHINVYWDFYVRSVNWGFSDNQTLTVSGTVSGTFNFLFNVGGGIADQYVGRLTLLNQGQSYNGGPVYSVTARISGSYLGATPSCSVSYSLPAKPPNVPTAPGVSVSSVTGNSAKITLSASDPRGSSITSYLVQVSSNSSFTSIVATLGGSGTVSGLQSSLTYWVRARAHNGVGDSAWSSTASFTTGATAPGVPTAVNAGSITSSTASISFTPPSSTGGTAITGYEVQTAEDASFSQKPKTTTGTSSPIVVSGLTPASTYWYRVRAKNAASVGSYSVAASFTTLVGLPRIISPSQGIFRPLASAAVTVSAQGIEGHQTIVVQLSQDVTFTANVHTLSATPGTTAKLDQYDLSDSYYLKTGVWYARVRVQDNSTGYITPWSPTVSWTEQHVPTASPISPSGGGASAYSANVPFVFRFLDPAGSGDSMSAYQLVLENNNNGAVIFDSGKTVLNAVNNANVSVNVAIASTLKNVSLRWKVRAWDQGDTPSSYSNYSVFTLADLPVVSVISPASGLTVNTGAPTFSWVATIPSGGTQKSASVDVYDATGKTLIWHGDVTGAITSITPAVVVLRNANTYTYVIKVTDTLGLVGTARDSFTTEYIAPDSIAYTVDGSGADELGYNLVDWTGALPDDQFASWKVYRQDVATGIWGLISTVTDINTRSYRDYMLQAGRQYLYSVTQVATRSGTLLESPVGFWLDDADNSQMETRIVDTDLSHYWIINPDDTDQSVRLLTVIKNSTTEEYESETYQIIGRGRHTDYGDRLGYTGTLTCQVRIPERPSSFKQRIEELRAANETYYLRDPFGKLFQVSLGNPSWDPIAGVGTSEMGDMQLPYEEVG